MPAEQRDTPATRSAKPSTATQDTWMLHWPTLITGGLVSLIAEVSLVAWVGLTRWLLINAAIGLVILIAVTVQRLRRKGASRPRAGRGVAAGRPAAAGGSPRQRLAGRFGIGRASGGRSPIGRSGGGASGSTAGRSGATPGQGNPLSRLFRRPGSSGGSAVSGGSPSSAGRSGLPAAGRKLWLFGRRGTSGTSGASPSRGSAARPGGAASPSSRPGGARSLWPFRRGAAAGATIAGRGPSSPGRGSAAGGGATPAKRSWWSGLRRSDQGQAKTTDKTKAPTKGGPAGAKPATSEGGADKPRRRFWGLWESRSPADTKEEKKAPEAPAPKRQDAAAPKEKAAQPEPTRGTRRPEPAPATPVPRAGGRHSGAPGGFMTAPAHKDDASLQGWGRNLRHIAPAYDELGKKYNQVYEEDAAAAEALRKIAAQGETDLPVAKPLAAEMSTIAAEAKAIAVEQEALNARRRKLRDRAEPLPAQYRREHETDEDRVNSPRNGRAAEKRADVSAAEQDT